jgi:predicted dehydrogenase/NADPH:quinone reductase-like Zn-dependent oxidoreductase
VSVPGRNGAHAAWLDRQAASPVDGSRTQAYAIRWPELGRASLERVAIEQGPGDLVVDVVASIVCSGTERARFLGLRNARVTFPHSPGYTASGVVAAVGAAVSGFEPGDRVALLNVPHQSRAALPPAQARLVPDEVDLADAAILQIALVAVLGLRRAQLDFDEPYGVIGMGLVGALTRRLARALGAGAGTAIAKSTAKEAVARNGGARFLAVDRDAAAIGRLELPVVVEATGDPRALAVAVDAAAPGGRVVLLGSPRGTAPFDLMETIRRKGLRLAGAHITGLEGMPGIGPDGVPEMTGAIIRALATGSLVVADLFEDVDPREAASVYRRLANDRHLVGARFDWARLAGCRDDEPAARPGRRRALDPAPAAGPSPGERARLARRASTALELVGERPRGRPFRFGFVGCGEIAVLNARAVAMTPGTTLTACFDPDAALARDLGAEHRASVTPSLVALLERDDVDGVVLSVPHHLHAPFAVAAAKAGKHVVVEKPIAIDLESAMRMMLGVEGTGVQLSVCFPERYSDEVRRARQILEHDGIGRLAMVEQTWYADKPVSYLYGGFSGRSPSTWRMHRRWSGGGTLLMNFCHGLDIVHHLTGMEVRSVSASIMNVEQVGDIEDTVVVNARFRNGALGVLAGSAAARGLRHESLRILGSEGRLELRPAGMVYTNRLLPGLGVVPNEPTDLGSPARPDIARSRYFAAFAEAAREGRRPDVTLDDGVFVQAVIEGAYEAATTGGHVDPAELLRRAKDSIAETSPIEGISTFVEDWRELEEMMADHVAPPL